MSDKKKWILTFILAIALGVMIVYGPKEIGFFFNEVYDFFQ